MSDCPSQQQLASLLADAADDAERESLEEHVGACHTCQGRLETLAVDAAEWRSWEHRLREVRTSWPDDTLPAARGLPEPWPVVPGYELLEVLGRGGMGVVFKARQLALGRLVALKFLPADYTHDQGRLDRFLREARTASALNHPQICTVHVLGEHEGRPFIVMELIEGFTLRAMLDRRPGVDEAARLIGQAARALAVAHAAGVVHRDIKPENIMVRGDSQVKVLDFGLARQLPTLAAPDAGDAHDTEPGVVMGTLAYMSPEQTRGLSADSASDIFSLGIVLYELVTGRHPFEAESPLEIVQAITKRQVVPASRLNAEVPAALVGLIEAMLHKDRPLRPTAAKVETTLTELADLGPPPIVKSKARPIVHRQLELDALRGALHEADAGTARLVCLAGEPGIGKTTLVEDFLTELATSDGGTLIARGHCSERLAGTEAYQPVIEALGDLLREETSGSVARLMKVVAPTWYSQIYQVPLAVATADRAETSRAFSQPAMLREFCSLLQEASRLSRVVLFFDDVHWADVSTVDLLAHFGRTCREMRVLVVVTYRPTEMLLGPHPFHGVKQELQSQGVCTELAVSFLGRSDIEHYLTLAFPDHTFPADFAELIHARTEGSPLFMVELLHYLRERGVIAESGGRWVLAQTLPDLRKELPESVRSMIERKLDRLERDDRRLLAAASVQGHEFDSTVVAETLKQDPAEVEERLQGLDQIHGLVRLVREYEFPDRTLTVRYAFVHILYQQALYTALSPSRRGKLSAALANALLSHQGAGNTSQAAELAYLYEVGRDFGRAARQFHLAAQNAAHVFAHGEAVALARRGLRLLQALPETPDRDALELTLQTTLGMQLQVTEGFGAADAMHAYTRARELSRRAASPVPQFPVLWGLWLFSKVRSDLARAQEMADELLTLARELHDHDLALQAHQALGMTAFCCGRPADSVQHVEQVSALYDPDRHRAHSFLFGQDPAVICKAYGAVALWLLGYPDQAERQSDAAIEMSRELSPSSQAVALHFAAMLHQLRGDGRRVRTYAADSRSVAAEHGFSFWLAGGGVLSGWALAASGSTEVGLNRLRNGLRDWRATDSITYQTYFLGLLADVLARKAQFDEGLRVLQEALALAQRTGERLYEAELHRLHGELLLRHALHADSTSEAERCFQQALEVARRQQARSLELRAAMSLARLLHQQNRSHTASSLLNTAYSAFTEGFDTPDLRAAASLLAVISDGARGSDAPSGENPT